MERNIDYKRIGRRIKEQRESHAMTQAQLAEAVGCSDGYISQVERGISSPSLELLARLSLLYRIPVDYLLLDGAQVLPEYQIDGRIKDQLERAAPATLRAVSDMIEILLAQQEALGAGAEV